MQKVRWGLLSTANINRRIIPAIRADIRGELVAVASREETKARAYAQEWGIPEAYGSYHAMLDSGSLDAVYIGLPNHMHAEWSIKAMQRGCHVLCEKPFALSVEDVDLMISASQDTGCRLAEALMYRHHPQILMAEKFVREGKLGEISLIRGTFNFLMPESYRQPEKLNVRLVPEWGGGSLWDLGIYPLSFAQFIMGGPPELVMGSQVTGKIGVDETFAGLLRYRDDRLAQISCSFSTPFQTFVEIVGTKGRLHLNRPFILLNAEQKMVFYPSDGPPKELPLEQKELYSGEIEDMNAAILDNEANYLKLDETRNHVKTILSLYKSANENIAVAL